MASIVKNESVSNFIRFFSFLLRGYKLKRNLMMKFNLFFSHKIKPFLTVWTKTFLFIEHTLKLRTLRSVMSKFRNSHLISFKKVLINIWRCFSFLWTKRHNFHRLHSIMSSGFHFSQIATTSRLSLSTLIRNFNMQLSFPIS